MSVFWNKGIASTNAGLDILGLRGADQSHEARWTGGITTVSGRARYLSLLPWFIDEWHRRALAADGQARFDEDGMMAALRRLEKVIFFATAAGKSLGESGDVRGVLGSDIWAEELVELEAGGTTPLDSPPRPGKETARGGASLGTYTQPCIQLQLLAEGTPLGVPLRGREVAEIRRGALQNAPIVDLIFGGGSVRREDIVAVAAHFSMNAVAGDEREHLRQVVTGTGEGLSATVDWVLRSAQQESISPAELIADAYGVAAKGGAAQAGPALAYAQYDLLRRVHFALELALQAITTELAETGPRDVRGIVRRLGRVEQDSLVALGVFTNSQPVEGLTMAQLGASLDGARLLARPLTKEARSLEPGAQAAYSVALLIASAAAVRVEPSLAPSRDSVTDRALQLVDASAERRALEVVRDLFTFVVERHLFTTFRKMAGGQPCSLRFVSDGRRLQPTDQSARAGMSGQRLTNVLVILSDLGFFSREAQRFALSAAGRARVA